MESLRNKILIVEDETLVAMELEIRLKIGGFKVVGKAISGDKAIEYAEEFRPDLILMDINIRGNKDGIETAHLILSFLDTKIIFVTAYNDSNTIARIKSIPFSTLLPKPFSKVELINSINHSLNESLMIN